MSRMVMQAIHHQLQQSHCLWQDADWSSKSSQSQSCLHRLTEHNIFYKISSNFRSSITWHHILAASLLGTKTFLLHDMKLSILSFQEELKFIQSSSSVFKIEVSDSVFDLFLGQICFIVLLTLYMFYSSPISTANTLQRRPCSLREGDETDDGLGGGCLQIVK